MVLGDTNLTHSLWTYNLCVVASMSSGRLPIPSGIWPTYSLLTEPGGSDTGGSGASGRYPCDLSVRCGEGCAESVPQKYPCHCQRAGGSRRRIVHLRVITCLCTIPPRAAPGKTAHAASFAQPLMTSLGWSCFGRKIPPRVAAGLPPSFRWRLNAEACPGLDPGSSPT